MTRKDDPRSPTRASPNGSNDDDNGSSTFVPRYLRSNLSRAVLLYALILALFVTYGKYAFYRDPLSVFFSEQHGYDRFYSVVREWQAKKYMFTFDSPDVNRSPELYTKAGDNPEICAAFVSVGRRGIKDQYLETSVASLLLNLTVPERRALHLKVFFADPDPAAHPSYTSNAINTLVDEVFTYPRTFSISDLTYTTNLAAEFPRRDAVEKKSILDYARALQHCVNSTKAPYIAIFEDDVLFADSWLARTLTHLRSIETMMRDPRRVDPTPHDPGEGRTNTWLYLRLFNQERSTGWTGGTGFFANNVPLISLGVAVPVLTILLCLRRNMRRAPLGRALDAPVLSFAALVGIPTFVWLFYASGKASLLPPAAGVREEFFGCCSQALVYNRAHAAELASFMLETSARRNGGRGDMLSREFAFEKGYPRISGYPMVVQHVGGTSATGTTSDEAQRIWSMAFEGLDEGRLRREHGELVGRLWPEGGL